MIKFQNVTKVYPPNLMVLDDVSFEVSAGEFVCIVGKSGAGKTTLIRLVLGMEIPTSGEVFFDGQNVGAVDRSTLQRIRRNIGGIYQDYKLLPAKTVYENVAYVLAVEGRKNHEIHQEVHRVLDVIGLQDRLHHFPRQLSGGEQQRLAVARALVTHPRVIIADEPTGNLDPYNTYEVISLLEKINRLGKTVILSTHDREIVNRLGRRVITIEDGRVLRDEARGKFMI